jgi:hypothetical protein
LEKHWAEISSILDRSTGSLSKPIFTVGGPRSLRITPHSELPKARLKAFSRFKFCAITDVSRCYPSIYTHSIPWAINGKARAKEDTSNYSSTVFGNRLDFIFRQAQDAQTIGIPVGPDTSRIVAEIILSAVDELFLSRYGKKKPTYLRHVDDYWIGGDTFDDCEKHLQGLRGALRGFELDLNDLKTRIVSTSSILGDSWPAEFERDIKQSFVPRYVRTRDPIVTLSAMIERANEQSDDGMIRHAIRKLDENSFWDGEWEVLEHFLAHCAVHFPHSFDYVARVISWRVRRDKPIDKALWKDVTLAFCNQSSVMHKDAEALWSLWLINELRISVPRDVSENLLAHSNPIVLAFLAHMYANGRVNDKAVGKKLADAVLGNPFCGSAWPLALELNFLNLLGQIHTDYTATEPALKVLHENGYSLIDWNALPAVFVSEDGETVSEPDHAIEDITWDYEDSMEDEDDIIEF